MTVSRFVKVHGVQAAINAGFFRPTEYYLPEGTPMTVQGLLISQGNRSTCRATYSASLYVDAENHARIYPNNWPAADTNGIWTAVSGDYPVLVEGTNIGRKYLSLGGIHDVNPRTSVGFPKINDFYLVIDGRQSGYSEGAFDYETAAWLQLLGAWDGINLDGGGSSTMSVQGVNGNPVRLNRSSAVADRDASARLGASRHLCPSARGIVNPWLRCPMMTRPASPGRRWNPQRPRWNTGRPRTWDSSPPAMRLP